MAEILTESFCERCGTRYTFEANAPSRGRVGKIKMLSRGLRNYVLSDDTTLEEALDEARGEEERMLSAQQLEAFHQTFNFCMSCRQYTCANCWNEIEARCLSCAPDLTHDVLPTAFPDLPIVPTFADAPATRAPEQLVPPVTAWPSSDLPAELAAVETPPAAEAPFVAAAASSVSAEPVVDGPASDEAIEEEPDERLVARLAALGAMRVVPPSRPEPVVTEPAAEVPEPVAEVPEPVAEVPEPVAEVPEPVAEVPEPEPSVEEDEAEIAAMLAASAAAAAATPASGATDGEAQPVAATVEPPIEEPTVAAGPAVPAQPGPPESAPEPKPVPVDLPLTEPAAATLAERVGWTMVAPETPLVAEDRVAAAQPTGNGHETAPSWPGPSDAPQWPTPRPAPVAAGHRPHHGTNALWVASSRDVVSRPGSGVSACITCGLPLSANARFCRRCGSRQLN
jgi:ribosomal protein L40E